ncbi:MAG TPA: hypothetical protein VGO00_25660 [Kofleriaceae bacterium]|nr:hypothetical protein [Kofleriaceae bacterium]
MLLRSTICLACLAIGCTTTSADTGTAANPIGDTRALTCEIIAGQNCWRDALAEVAACAPGASVAGMLSSDAKSCTYASGDSVTFEGDITNLGLESTFSFELTTGGSLCTGFSTEEPETRTLRTALGTASWTLADTVTLSCPDGTTYQTDTLSALDCDGFPDVLGFVWASSATSFQFELVAKPQNINVLQCAM